MTLNCFSSADACRMFGLGLAAGLVLASAAFIVHQRGVDDTEPAAPNATTPRSPPPAASAASGERWHRSAPSDDLSSAVRISLGLAPAVRSGAAQKRAPGQVPGLEKRTHGEGKVSPLGDTISQCLGRKLHGCVGGFQ